MTQREFVMPLRLRQAQSAYQQDLLTRTRMAKCHLCGARPGEMCKARNFNTGRVRDVKWCHQQRTREAKRLGFVKGRRIR